MNAKKRKALKVIIERMEQLDSLREEIKEQLGEILEEEQESLDNLPESFQASERGQQIQECIGAMENVVGELDCMDVENLIEQLQEICE